MDTFSNTTITMGLAGCTLSLGAPLKATEEQQKPTGSSTGDNDVVAFKPIGDADTDTISNKTSGGKCFAKATHKVGTWNVRTINQGKLNIMKDEMERMEIDILGISELKWTGKGHFQSEDYKVFYAGYENLIMNRVAISLNKDMLNYVLGYYPIKDRIISIRIQGNPINMTIIQVYAPTTAASGKVIEELYNKLLNNTPRKDLTIIMDDCNAKVGKMKDARVTGQFGLGDRNEAGDRLVQFCEENELSITNNFFEQPDCRLYTRTTPDGNHRNQIDYIICKQRWKTAVQSVKTRPDADCGSDHELLLAGVKIKLKKKRKQEHTH